MTPTTYYRIQPTGLPLFGHTSEDWSGDVFAEVGRVCAYSDTSLVLSGWGDDWSWKELRGDTEIVGFTGRDERELASCNAGCSVVPVAELWRRPLRDWLAEQEDWDGDD